MKKKDKRKGKQRLRVIDNIIYSNLIFKVASGDNYAQKIYEEYGRKKPASVISRQLNILEKEESFLTSEIREDKTIFPMKRLRIYSINWGKVIEEFIEGLKEEFTSRKKEHKRLGLEIDKNNSPRADFTFFSKEFENNIKKNKYLINIFEKEFSEIGRLKDFELTLNNVFGFLMLYADFNYDRSLEGVIRYLEEVKAGIYKEPAINIFKKEAFFKKHREIEISAKNKVDKMLERDKELKEIYDLNRILGYARKLVTLRSSLYVAIHKVGNEILEKHLTKEQFKEYQEIKKKNPFSFI